jgi:hypothetical protein
VLLHLSSLSERTPRTADGLVAATATVRTSSATRSRRLPMFQSPVGAWPIGGGAGAGGGR